MKIEQASIVLTGASGGLGSEVARQLVYEGARILLVGHSKEPLIALAATLCAGAADRTRVDAMVIDLTEPAGRAAVVQAAVARNANVLINNAGIPLFGPAGQIHDQQVEKVMAINVVAPMLLTAGLLPQFLKQPHAQVINIGSTLGSIGVPGFSVYGASKAALHIYTESLRRELASTSVRVQYFAPRAINTAFNSPQVNAYNAKTGSHSDSADVIANKVVAMLRNEAPEHYVGFAERLGARINGLFPRLIDSGFAKHRRALMDVSAAKHASPFPTNGAP